MWPLATILEVVEAAREAGLATPMDGARLLNAVVASGVSAHSFAEPFDSAWIDLTKGLGAPVGAVLAGSRAFIHEAWRLKQRWGGAMRQSGFIAAAGLYALDNQVDRLAVDHENARFLATGIGRLPGLSVQLADVETNIVFFDTAGTGRPAAKLVAAAKARGVGLGAFGLNTIRAVTHIDGTRADVERAINVLGALCDRVDA